MKVQLSSISDLFTADTLAEELNVSRSMVYYLRDTGKLKFRKDDVVDYLQKEKGYEVV